MESSASSLACLVLEDKKDNPENRDIDQHDEREGKRDTSTADDLEIPNPLEMLDFVNLLLKKLDGKTLKSSLMVSKLWNEEGMKLFIKNHYIRVPPKLSLKTKQETKETIKEFKKLFSKFNFIPNVVINKSRDIQILKDSKILEQVKYVKINKKIENYDATIEKVIEECPNLSFLEAANFDLDSYSLVRKSVESRKVESFTISNLLIQFFYTDVHEILEQFANSGVGVVHLLFDLGGQDHLQLERISRALEKILHSSKDCLETLALEAEGNILSSIKNIPVLLQLKELNIRLWPQEPLPALELATIFPSGFKFSENCPNLKTCSFEFFCLEAFCIPFDGETFLDMVFATTGPASSVKYLNYFSECEPMKLDKLFQTFDGIESLKMGPCGIKTNLSPRYAVGQILKNLKLLHLNHSYQVLAGLTGYPLDFIIGLWNSSADLKNLDLPPRTGPSIVDLQGLESFTMDWCKEELVSKFDELIYELALRHMPKMKKRQETA